MPKKKNGPSLEELLEQQWCYYCEREFAHNAALVTHMRDMHFKCQRPGCHKRMSSAQGLEVHVTQVHKERVTAIENALPGRSGLKPEIYGMLGIPEELLQQRKERITQQYFQAQAERQAATGNPPPGATSGEPAHKKVKTEDKSTLKERLAAHKAARAAAAASAAANSGNNTPTSTAPAIQSPVPEQEPAQSVRIYSAAPVHYNYIYSHYGHAYQPSWPSVHAPQASASPQGYTHPQSFAGVPAAGYSAYPVLTYGQQHPPHMPPFPGQMPPPYPPHAGYNTVVFAQYHHSAAPNSASPPPATSYQPRQASPAQAGANAHPSALPQLPPGLPQRPTFAVPPVTPYSMQQMHQGLHSNQTQRQPSQERKSVDQNGHAPEGGAADSIVATNAQVDEVVANAANPSESNGEPANPISDTAAPAPASQSSEMKPAKKDDKKFHLVYSDNEVSPEEKMVKLPRYAQYLGLAKQSDNTTLSSSVEQTAGASGVATGQDDVPNAG